MSVPSYSASHKPRSNGCADPAAIGPMVIRLFDHWKLTCAERANLLGLSPRTRSTLARYRNGGHIGKRRDLRDRVGHLLGVHATLRLLFPRNRDLAYNWMRTPNRAFDDLAPVDLINRDGFSGLLRVRTYLDRARLK